MKKLIERITPKAWQVDIVILGIITLYIISPAIPGFIAPVIADIFGCELSEAGSVPCFVCGRDIGESLWTMGLVGWGWLILITLITGAPVLIGYLLLIIVRCLDKKGW